MKITWTSNGDSLLTTLEREVAEAIIDDSDVRPGLDLGRLYLAGRGGRLVSREGSGDWVNIIVMSSSGEQFLAGYSEIQILQRANQWIRSFHS